MTSPSRAGGWPARALAGFAGGGGGGDGRLARTWVPAGARAERRVHPPGASVGEHEAPGRAVAAPWLPPRGGSWYPEWASRRSAVREGGGRIRERGGALLRGKRLRGVQWPARSPNGGAFDKPTACRGAKEGAAMAMAGGVRVHSTRTKDITKEIDPAFPTGKETSAGYHHRRQEQDKENHTTTQTRWLLAVRTPTGTAGRLRRAHPNDAGPAHRAMGRAATRR